MPARIDNQTLSLIISDREKEVNWDSFSTSDWDALAHKAHSEGVGPLLYWTLSKSGKFSSLPNETRNFLRLMYAGTWMQNQTNFKELEILARLFHEAEIPVVLLKGICFALTIYPDPGLRPMGDMDVLVPASRLSEAVEIAKSLGYEDSKPDASPGLRDLLNHEVCLQKTGTQSITLELHHSLVADKTFSYAVPVDWFWEQTEPLRSRVKITSRFQGSRAVAPLALPARASVRAVSSPTADGNTEVVFTQVLNTSSKTRFENLLMLTPVAQVLYAASHAMLQHGGQNTPLRWYYDLDQLIRFYGERMDWDLLLSQAKTFEWGSALDAALSQTSAYFDTPVPARVRASLSESSDRHRGLVALKQIRPATHILEEQQKLLSLNWYGRFRLVLALIAPSPAYMRWRYQLKSAWVLPAYYLFRWGVILKDAVRTVILSLGRGRQSDPKGL